MQRTRLDTLFNQVILRFRQWAFNPWRRLSVIIISLLFGNFFATAIAATSGQTATLDVAIAAALVIGVEAISWLYYRFTPQQKQARAARLATEITTSTTLASQDIDSGPVRTRSTLIEALNAFKIGMSYGFFVEAFKLGS
jgi:hypothetical protein